MSTQTNKNTQFLKIGKAVYEFNGNQYLEVEIHIVINKKRRREMYIV